MYIGIPREIKTLEGRVGLIPAACAELVALGHDVFIESAAGILSGYPDKHYQAVGVTVLPDAASVYAKSELIVKVKEPQSTDLKYLRADHLLFCFLHLAAYPELTKALQKIGLTAIGFETVEVEGQLPILMPMSMIAGRLATMQALGHNVTALYPYHETLCEVLEKADLVICAVLIPGKRAPVVVDEEMVSRMQSGSVLIDISVDQGGCVATTHPTTYAAPTYVYKGVTHFAVTNMPGAVPRTASQVLSTALLPFVITLAQPNWVDNAALCGGINVQDGKIVHPALSTES
ncbi:alanine dehydrogenase [Candidatus Thiomargarita nelsonii]|uniref:alanine dehydrogenase n=1 Tax=Candidatus Thiomargarita nelsonii TaxID=1003181 RepID=A0A0A6PDT7_9GAMM|nr:alanine dehydrogenase [Candidatus Thiomargarita nelsonii]